MENNIDAKNWSDAANNGDVLSQTLLTMGEVSEALTIAEQALGYAVESENPNLIEFVRSDLSNAYLAAGLLDEALAGFNLAEELRAERHPDRPELISVRGYQYGDLLLAVGENTEALHRGQYQLDVANEYLGKGLALHDVGLAQLLVGRSQYVLKDANAETSLDKAVDDLRKAGREDMLPVALLARAALRRDKAAEGDASMIDKALEDLHEVEEIAGDEMGLYLVDLALERARLALDVPAAFEDPNSVARDNTADAARRIAETGYHRRDGELAALQERLNSLPA